MSIEAQLNLVEAAETRERGKARDFGLQFIHDMYTLGELFGISNEISPPPRVKALWEIARSGMTNERDSSKQELSRALDICTFQYRRKITKAESRDVRTAAALIWFF